MREILEGLYYGRIRPNEMGKKAEEATIRELDAAQAELLELVGGCVKRCCGPSTPWATPWMRQSLP